MVFNDRTIRGMRTRLWVLQIPPQFHDDFLSVVEKWVVSSGVEWTISRLKSLKVDLFRRKAGLKPLTWVRKNRSGDIAGTIGAIFRWSDRSEENFRKAVQLMMCYTCFRFDTPTAKQVKKFTSAVSSPPPVMEEDFLKDLCRSIRARFRQQTVRRDSDVSLITYRGSPEKRKPSVGLSSVPQDSNILDDLRVFTDYEFGKDILKKYWSLFEPTLQGYDYSPDPERTVTDDHRDYCVGKIAFIQELGGKLRSVASPYILYQLALRHFGSSVYSFVRSLPWDCTHDQSAPVPVLQEHLKRGETVHSVDLSSATDYFPLEVQSAMMRQLFGNILDIELFEFISRASWHCPALGRYEMISWRRGQPLGLYPSFAVFTASHGMLLWYLNGCKWKDGDKPSFYVLGDDVVILSETLYKRYIEILEKWGCPYSPEKTLSSSELCEFAGKVITSKSVTSQYKWREMSDNNFVDICRQLGPRSRCLLSSRQKAVFDVIKHCSLPFGLNFSYPGSDLSSMEALSLAVIGERCGTVLGNLVDIAPVINRNLYNSVSEKPWYRPIDISFTGVLEMVRAFDEKVNNVIRFLLPQLSQAGKEVFRGLEVVSVSRDLPPESYSENHTTALDRYERLLNL